MPRWFIVLGGCLAIFWLSHKIEEESPFSKVSTVLRWLGILLLVYFCFIYPSY